MAPPASSALDRPDAPTVDASATAPPTDGAAQPPMYIVLNVGSGRGDLEAACATIEGVLHSAGRRHEILRVEAPEDLGAVAQRAVAQAREHGGIVVAAGGDGTLNAVAQATLGSGCPFGVIPRGTFNYFGRTHGIAGDTAAATSALLTARLHPVQVGLVNDRVFLVNASLGLYPQSLEDREEQSRHLGRSRMVAAWAALVTLWRELRPMRVILAHEGVSRRVRALTLFVGNNRLQLEQVGLSEAGAVDDGKLVAILVRPLPRLSLLVLLVRGAFGSLAQAEGVEHFPLTDLTVTPLRRSRKRFKVATDGEVVSVAAPLRFKVAQEPLLLLVPVGEPSAAQ